MDNKRGIICLKKTIEVRRACDVELDTPVAIFDLAEKLGVEVKFRPETSLEGMYFKNEKLILVSSHRPLGRQAFTCGHELGHHVFDHGTSVDEIVEGDFTGSRPTEELEADLFAAHLLMPLKGFKKAFKARNWDVKSLKTHQAFSMASLFGVTYKALLTHLCFNLKILPRSIYEQLVKVTPKSIKSSLLGFEYPGELIVVDRFWNGRPVDLIHGQYAIFTKNLQVNGLENVEVVSEASRYLVVRATKQMSCKTDLQTMPIHVRVSGSKDTPFVGRNSYRYLENPIEHT